MAKKTNCKVREFLYSRSLTQLSREFNVSVRSAAFWRQGRSVLDVKKMMTLIRLSENRVTIKDAFEYWERAYEL